MFASPLLSETFCLPSPLQLIEDECFAKAGVAFYLKRDDLIHPQISGNKWRKLKYNLREAHLQQKNTLLTFGGAYSNHLYATAAAGGIFGFKTIGIVRGELTLPLNATLTFAIACGMQLHYLNRTDYREKNSLRILAFLQEKFGDFYLIPEGGANAFGEKGCSEIVSEINLPFDYLCCPCGTGTTFAGLLSGVKDRQKVLGFSVLRGVDFAEKITESGQVFGGYHFGGSAKTTPELLAFMQDFEKQYAILLDPVYTAKMLFGIYDLLAKGFFQPGETVVALHTGGLQGRAGIVQDS
jgi:1-aminocyclopropane-1-carboxylate deaminase